MYKQFEKEFAEQFIKNTSNKLCEYTLYQCLSLNPNITWEIVQANSDKPWDYTSLSKNPNITWEIVQVNRDKPWSYHFLSSNPNITWEIVQANPDVRWTYSALARNPMPVAKNNYIRKCFQKHFTSSGLAEEF